MKAHSYAPQSIYCRPHQYNTATFNTVKSVRLVVTIPTLITSVIGVKSHIYRCVKYKTALYFVADICLSITVNRKNFEKRATIIPCAYIRCILAHCVMRRIKNAGICPVRWKGNIIVQAYRRTYLVIVTVANIDDKTFISIVNRPILSVSFITFITADVYGSPSSFM